MNTNNEIYGGIEKLLCKGENEIEEIAIKSAKSLGIKVGGFSENENIGLDEIKTQLSNIDYSDATIIFDYYNNLIIDTSVDFDENQLLNIDFDENQLLNISNESKEGIYCSKPVLIFVFENCDVIVDFLLKHKVKNLNIIGHKLGLQNKEEIKKNIKKFLISSFVHFFE